MSSARKYRGGRACETRESYYEAQPRPRKQILPYGGLAKRGRMRRSGGAIGPVGVRHPVSVVRHSVRGYAIAPLDEHIRFPHRRALFTRDWRCAGPEQRVCMGLYAAGCDGVGLARGRQLTMIASGSAGAKPFAMRSLDYRAYMGWGTSGRPSPLPPRRRR